MHATKNSKLFTSKDILDIDRALANAHVNVGHFDTALEVLKNSAGQFAGLHGSDSIEYEQSLRDLAMAYIQMERWPDALDAYQLVRSINAGKSWSNIIEYDFGISICLQNMGCHRDNVAVFQRIIDCCEREGQVNDKRYRRALY